MQTRIKNLIKEQHNSKISKILESYKNANTFADTDISCLIENIKIEVKLYDSDPIMFLMGFNESLFVEQYHFGRPIDRVPPKGCIGKYVPVMQYKKGSDGYVFFSNHFEYLWKTGNNYTKNIFDKAVENYLQEGS